MIFVGSLWCTYTYTYEKQARRNRLIGEQNGICDICHLLAVDEANRQETNPSRFCPTGDCFEKGKKKRKKNALSDEKYKEMCKKKFFFTAMCGKLRSQTSIERNEPPTRKWCTRNATTHRRARGDGDEEKFWKFFTMYSRASHVRVQISAN